MGDVTSSSTIKKGLPNTGITEVIVKTPATADASDTVTVTLGSYGISNLWGVQEWVHTTEDSVIRMVGGSLNADKAGYSTTAVSSGVLTITLGTGTNKKHVFKIIGD